MKGDIDEDLTLSQYEIHWINIKLKRSQQSILRGTKTQTPYTEALQGPEKRTSHSIWSASLLLQLTWKINIKTIQKVLYTFITIIQHVCSNCHRNWLTYKSFTCLQLCKKWILILTTENLKHTFMQVTSISSQNRAITREANPNTTRVHLKTYWFGGTRQNQK